MFVVTVVAVPDAVLQHGVPLLLLLLRHNTEVVVTGVRVPQDEGERGCTLDERVVAHFGLDACTSKSHDRRSKKVEGLGSEFSDKV